MENQTKILKLKNTITEQQQKIHLKNSTADCSNQKKEQQQKRICGIEER